MASLPMPPMGGAPPTGGPPPAPGNPTLANIPPSAPPSPMGPQQSGGALPRLVFQITQMIATLAKALPVDSAEKLDAISQQLQEAVAEGMSGGGTNNPTQGPGGSQGPY